MKRILITALSVLLVAGMAISGTVAYLTDRDSAKNTMTTGLVEIQQYEQDRYGDDFVQNQTILPITGSAQQEHDEKGYPKEGMNYVDKLVTVKNTGNTDAYVRTLIAVPNYHYVGQNESSAADNVLHWNMYDANIETNKVEELIPGTNQYVLNQWYWDKNCTDAYPSSWDNWNRYLNVEISGRSYCVYIATHKTALAAGERTAPSMQGFYIDSKVDYNHDTGKYTYEGKDTDLTGYVDILVLSQAVQAGGFETANEAFEAAMPLGDTDEARKETLAGWFSDVVEPNAISGGVEDINDLRNATSTGGSIVLEEDVMLESSQLIQGSFANNDSAFKQNGGVINGNGASISVPRGNYGVSTKNGTIKNLTIEQAGRAIGAYDPTDDIILENVTIGENVGYGISIQSESVTPADSNCSLIVKNSTLRGWISYGTIRDASFENCTFGHSFYFSDDINDSTGRYIKPYVTTTFTNCNFCADYYLDLFALKNGCTVTFKNCRVNGVLITAANLESAFGRVELPTGKAVADIVTVTNT